MSCHSRLSGVTAIALLLWGLHSIAAEPDILIVDLWINQQPSGESFVLKDQNGSYYVGDDVLDSWQISKPWPQPAVFRGKNYYSLSQFPGAVADLAHQTMRLNVTMPPNLMPRRTIDMGRPDTTATSEAFGLYMDYQVNWLNYQNVGQNSTNAQMQPVVFGKFGSLRANTLYRHSAGNSSPDGDFVHSGLSVLELTYTRDDPDRLSSLRVGDVFSRAGLQGRALRIGGIQLATNFDTQPMFITHPLPSFYGEASVPTALDVYVNGKLRRRQEVEPGSYVLQDLPVINGAGQLQVVARDALGRQQVYTQDFYSATDLLRDGLSDYSITLGALREEYGIENFHYGDFAATGSWRYGFSDRMTLEGHGEFTNGIGMISGSARYLVSSGGTVSAGLGLSAGRQGTGGSWQFGFRQQTGIINYNVDISGTSKAYDMVGLAQSLPKLQVFSSAGMNFFEYGSVGASVVHQSFHDRPKRTVVSANHSKSFGNVLTLSTYLSYVDADTDDFSVGVRFSMPFGNRHFANGGYSGSRGRSQFDAEFSKALPLGNGSGYRLGVGALDNRYIDGGLAMQTGIGTYMLDVRDSEFAGTVWQAGAIGSVAYLSGMTKFTRQIRNAFAVVNVGEFEGVRVYAENIEIGRTNENGQLFVPGLYPYMRNNLRIEIEDLPLNAKIGEIQTHAAPYFQSGVVVNFDVSVSNNVLMRVVLPNGSPVPEGAYAKINEQEKKYPVGRDGKLYLQGVDRSSLITLRWKSNSCNLDVPYPDSTAVIAKLGDIVCDPELIR